MKKYQHPTFELESVDSEIIMVSFEIAELFNGDGKGNDTDVDLFDISNWKTKQ